MKQTNTRDQIILVLGMLILLTAAHFFTTYHNWLKEIAATTFEKHYIFLRLWSVPVAALLFTVGWLVLFRLMIKHNNKVIAALFLVIGICILFYPSIVMTLGISVKLGIPVKYFGNSMFFFSSATVAAIGLIGILISADKEQIE